MTFRREAIPQFAALIEENGGSLTPAEGDLSRNVKGDILDFRPTSQQGKRWNLGDPKDQREILWMVHKKRSKLVIGSVMCKGSVQSCTINRSGEDVAGGWLDLVLIRKAREEEMQHVMKHAVYEKVPMSQCWKETGKNPTRQTGWTRTRERPSVRTRDLDGSRKNTTLDSRLDLFSATSPSWRE